MDQHPQSAIISAPSNTSGASTQPNMFFPATQPPMVSNSVSNSKPGEVSAETSVSSSLNLSTPNVQQLVQLPIGGGPPQAHGTQPSAPGAFMPPQPFAGGAQQPAPILSYQPQMQQPQPSNATKPAEPASAAHPRNVYVASLPLDFTDAQLQQMFSPFGRVLSAKVQYDHKNKVGKGYGFILYDNAASADLAVQNMMSAVVNGQRIQVRKAKANTKTSINAASGQQQSPSIPVVQQQQQQQQQIILQQQPQLITTPQGQVIQVVQAPTPMVVPQQVIGSSQPAFAPPPPVVIQPGQQVVFAQAPPPPQQQFPASSTVVPQDRNTSLVAPNVITTTQPQYMSAQPPQVSLVQKSTGAQ